MRSVAKTQQKTLIDTGLSIQPFSVTISPKCLILVLTVAIGLLLKLYTERHTMTKTVKQMYRPWLTKTLTEMTQPNLSPSQKGKLTKRLKRHMSYVYGYDVLDNYDDIMRMVKRNGAILNIKLLDSCVRAVHYQNKPIGHYPSEQVI